MNKQTANKTAVKSTKKKTVKKRRNMTKKQKKISAITVAIGLILCTVMVYFIYNEWWLKQSPFYNPETGVTSKFESYEPVELSSGAVTYKGGNSGDDVITNNQLNVLMVGFDVKKTNTDVILVASIDKSLGTLSILQIPRDTYVGIGAAGKINGVTALGDKNLSPINRLIKVINQKFKIPIDYYMTVDLEGFKDIVDAIGGIPMDVPQRIEYDAASIIPAGHNVLTGQQAEWFIRYRKGYYEGDIGRAKMQRLFLAAAMQHCKDLGSFTIIGALDELMEYCETDMNIGELKEFIAWGMNIKMEDMRIFMVPGEATYVKSPIDGKSYSVWSVHLKSTADMLNEFFRPYQQDVPLTELELEELANTIDKYENTDDSFSDLISGVKPGEKNENQ